LEIKLTAPITGPFTKTGYLNDIPEWSSGQAGVYKAYRMSRVWYRQAKPYTLPLQFDSMAAFANSVYDSTGPFGTYHGSWTEATASTPDFPDMQANVYNKAYAKFIDTWKNAVELGVATAEGREAVGMLSHRFGQLASFTRHLATGKLGLAAKDLGLEWANAGNLLLQKKKTKLPPRIERMIKRREASIPPREAIRSFSQLYLEFHFGWSPLLKDIHDACEVFSKPYKDMHVHASMTGSYPDPNNHKLSQSDGTWIINETRDGSYVQTVKLSADIVITNPNLAMMQSYGIANPLAVAWELVPFSFVLDWFVNVGDYLSGLTDFVGVKLINPQRTVFTRYTGSYINTETAIRPSSNNTSKKTWQLRKVSCSRRLDIGSGPILRPRAPKAWGIRRGLAAASLLMQRFPRQVIDANAISLAKSRSAFRANVFPQFYGKYW